MYGRIGVIVANVVMTCACDVVFGLDTRDESPNVDSNVDGPINEGVTPFVTPPPGPTNCAPMPAFESMTYEPAMLATRVTDLSAIADQRGGRLLGVDATTHGIVDLDSSTGVGAAIPSLAAPDGGMIIEPSALPDGQAIWFRQSQTSLGIFVAARDGDWVKQRELFGFVDPFNIELGTPAYHDGTVRMVITLQETASALPHFVEISSPDGRAWTQLATVALDLTGINGFVTGAALSADGCYFVFYNTIALNTRVYVIARDASGVFSGAPTPLVQAATVGAYPVYPSLSPDNSQLWFFAQVPVGSSVEYRLFVGQ